MVNRLIFLATSWINQNNSIYGSMGDSGWLDEALSTLKIGFTNFIQNQTDFIGDALRWLVVGLGLIIEAVLGIEGIDLTRILYGRLLDGVEVNKFGFELAPGNTFGVVGAMSYSVLRAAVISFMVIVAAYLLCKGIWLGSGEKALGQLKNNLGNYLICAALLFLMPHLYEVALYIRDLMLYAVGTLSGATQSGSFIKEYRQLATAISFFDAKNIVFNPEFWEGYNHTIEGSFFASCMYFGMVCMTVYFAYTYITNALSQMIAFSIFPLVALLSVKDTKTLGKWASSVLALIAVPIVDTILFAIPLRFAGAMDGSRAYAGSFVLFLVCMAIMPARKVVRSLIGGETFSSASGMGALLMMGRLATQVAGAAKGYATGVSDAGADRQKAAMFRELAGDPDARITDGGMAAFGGGKGGATVNVQRAQKMAQLATVDNFETKEFSDVLSDEQKANFYEERARRTEARSRNAAFGSVVGGLGGLGATFFGGPAAKMAGASIGASIGESLGPHIPQMGEMVGRAGAAVGRMGASIGRTVSSRVPRGESTVYEKPLEHVSGEVLTEVGPVDYSWRWGSWQDERSEEQRNTGAWEFVPALERKAASTSSVKNTETKSTVSGKAFTDGAKEEKVNAVGTKQLREAASAVLDSVNPSDSFDMEKIKGEIVSNYRKACEVCGYGENSQAALARSAQVVVDSVCEKFGSDLEGFRAAMGDENRLEGYSKGLDIKVDDLGSGLNSAEGQAERDGQLSEQMKEIRIERKVNLVDFAVMAGKHPSWNPNDLEAQNEAIRQTAENYIRKVSMEIVEKASPYSVQSDKEMEAQRMTGAFCHGFNADDLCKILGVDADIVRAYRNPEES